MKIVMLDADTLPVKLTKPDWCSQWEYRGNTLPGDIVSALSSAEIAITNKVPLRAHTLKQLPELRFICITATGYDCVDIEYCRNKNIAVSNVPGYSSRSVAEGVIASMFALRRNLVSYAQLGKNIWASTTNFCMHREPIKDIHESTLGIIGKGDIGSSVAKMAKALGMSVLFAERKGSQGVREGYTAFEEVLNRSDIISLHCPLSSETLEMMDKEVFALMKSDALIINTARGGLISESDLRAALDNNIIAGAALDVLSVEPPPSDHPLLLCSHPNLIITPHIAWASTSGVNNLINGINNNLTGYRSGKIINSII